MTNCDNKAGLLPQRRARRAGPLSADTGFISAFRPWLVPREPWARRPDGHVRPAWRDGQALSRARAAAFVRRRVFSAATSESQFENSFSVWARQEESGSVPCTMLV